MMRSYKGYIKDDPNFKTLFENTVMTVGNIFESAYCYNKLTKEELPIFQFGNDPTCALVGKNNNWCLVGGDVLVLRTWVDNTLRKIGELKNIYAFKAIETYTIQILTDPWSEQSAIWKLEIDLNKLTRPTSLIKLKDFRGYFDKPLTEQIEW
ncbi:MAG: hypothetical protein ABUL44_02440 [Flavobacterium sp.]